MHVLTDHGWAEARSFPVVSDVKAMVAPASAPGTLMLWAKDAGNLYVSRWEDGRFSFPKPATFEAEADEEDRQILALDTVGTTTWWIQRVGESLDLYTWSADQDKPQRTRFADVGKKTDKAIWLGGNQLLVQDQYARHPKLLELVEGKVQTRQPSHIERTKLDQYRLYEWNGELRAARLSDGVLRWLDDSLNAEDQIMLEGEQSLASFVPIKDGRAWALERGGEHVHLLAPDDSGILRLEKRIELPGGHALKQDAVPRPHPRKRRGGRPPFARSA